MYDTLTLNECLANQSINFSDFRNFFNLTRPLIMTIVVFNFVLLADQIAAIASEMSV